VGAKPYDMKFIDIAGKHIDFGDEESRPAEQLLRWHFRQAVFANMRGAGEPVFEYDFPPDSDMVGEIMSGPRAAERWNLSCSVGWQHIDCLSFLSLYIRGV